ncbi:MAG: hypothetical protein MSG78_06535 [Clostridiales bacterium]|nr:hypothetical protein [Clostridiales bacterium]
MKNKFCIILVFCICLLSSGCSMTMTTEERVKLLYNDGSQDNNIDNADNVIHEPKDNQMSRLTVKMEAYDMQTLGNVLLNLTPEEVQEKRYSDTTLYTYYSEKLGRPMDNCGIRSYSSYLCFNAIPEVDLYETIIGSVKNNFDEKITYNTICSNVMLKSTFQKEELNGLSIDEVQKICDDILEKIDCPVSYRYGYVLDVDSLNNIQENTWNKNQMQIPHPGYTRDEKGNPVGEVEKWQKEDEAFAFLYCPSYRGIAIEGFNFQSRIEMYYNEKNGVFFLRANVPHLTDQIVQEETVSLLSGKEIMMCAKPILKQIGVGREQITDISAVYYFSPFNLDVENSQLTLEPAWKVSYTKTVNGKEAADYILLEGTTGNLLSNET